ncbi:unnamed protein product [Boreogadus saida]
MNTGLRFSRQSSSGPVASGPGSGQTPPSPALIPPQSSSGGEDRYDATRTTRDEDSRARAYADPVQQMTSYHAASGPRRPAAEGATTQFLAQYRTPKRRRTSEDSDARGGPYLLGYGARSPEVCTSSSDDSEDPRERPRRLWSPYTPDLSSNDDMFRAGARQAFQSNPDMAIAEDPLAAAPGSLPPPALSSSIVTQPSEGGAPRPLGSAWPLPATAQETEPQSSPRTYDAGAMWCFACCSLEQVPAAATRNSCRLRPDKGNSAVPVDPCSCPVSRARLLVLLAVCSPLVPPEATSTDGHDRAGWPISKKADPVNEYTAVRKLGSGGERLSCIHLPCVVHVLYVAHHSRESGCRSPDICLTAFVLCGSSPFLRLRDRFTWRSQSSLNPPTGLPGRAKKFQEQVKESDDKWQDDLSKWKSRRKSVNSDIVKKKEEREQIEQNYGGDVGSGRKRRSLKDMQEERASRDSRRSVGSRLSSLSYLDEDEDVFAVPIPAPRSRSLYGRSNTADDLYSPPERSPAPSPAPSRPSIPSTEDEEPAAARPAPDRPASPPPPQEAAPSRAVTGGGTRASSTVTTVTSSSVSSNSSSAYAVRSVDLPARPRSISPAQEPSVTVMADAGKTPSPTPTPSPEPRSLVSKAPEPWRPKAGVRTAEKKEAPQYNPTMPPGVSRVSASLPRSTQRADSTTRLSSVIMPRPFGTQATRLSSLIRAPVTVDSHRRVNGDADVSTKSSVPGRYQQYMTLEDEASSQSSGEDENEEEGEDEANEEEAVGKGLSSNSKSVSQEPPRVKSETPALGSDASQENFSDMRISLNQKPNSSRDFGFHADWSASGTRVKSIQPDWDTDRPAAPFQNHKTINLTSSDHSTLVDGGSSNTSPTNTSLDFTSRKSPDGLGINAAPLHSVINVATNGLNGGVHQEAVTMRNKESEPMSLKNLKRRSEFFEQGGSETAISDIPVPALTPSASRWSWDPEEERRRQEKWQKEQDRLLQEKYKRDQEKMQEIWRKDQEEAYDSRQSQKTQSLEVDAARPSSTTQPSPAWEAQEEEEEMRRRKEAQEEQRQAEQRRRQEEEEELELRRFKEERERREQLQRRREAEEKERREEEEERREEERMKRTEELKKRAEEERKRRAEEEERVRSAAEEERKRRMEEDLRLQRRRDEERQEEERRRALDKQQQWKPSGFRSSQSHTLAYSDREKSKSTPEALDDVGFSERRAASGLVAADRPQRRSQQLLQTQADLERQQILQDMKKKTQLLTDNSWIRQQSTSIAPSKEPVDVPMRRGESLDNLDAPRSAWRSSWTPGSTSSIPSSTRPQSAIYGSSGAGGVVGGGTYYGGGYPARPGSVSGPPGSASTGSLRGGAAPPASSWRQQSPSLSPTTSPEPTSDPFGRQQRSRSVSGKKICTFCDSPLGKGAAMIIESLGLCYHLNCFKCMDCKSDLGGSEAGAEVRIRDKHLYCNTCYQRFKAGQPTSM